MPQIKGNIMKSFVRLIILITTLTFSLTADAAKGPLNKEWVQLSTQKLMTMGTLTTHQNVLSDTAIACYSIVADRYDSSMSKAEMHTCALAYMRLWFVYFYQIYDYSKCFSCLSHALDISKKAGIVMPDIYLRLGCMYQTISEETKTPKLSSKALYYYKQSMYSAMKIKDDKLIGRAFTCMVDMANDMHQLPAISREWNLYCKLPLKNCNPIIRNYNKLQYDVSLLTAKGEYEKAIEKIDKQIALVKGNEYIRLLYCIYINKSKLLIGLNRYDEAIALMLKSKTIAEEYNFKDCLLEIYGLLSDIYKITGNDNERNKYRDKYSNLKDTLTSYRQLASVTEMEFGNQLKGINEQMDKIKAQRARQSRIILFSVVVIIFIVAVLLIFYKKNKQLNNTNRYLYQKNQELLKEEEEMRQLRKKYDDKQNPIKDEVKYKKSRLDDDEKARIIELVEKVMEDTETICSQDFSVERLALMIDSKYKYVSQVINEHYGCNFNAFLNKYRIKEACMRLNDKEHYGNFTIESIGNSVGFKAMSSFVSSFKNFTGLTPSQYQKLSKEK